MTFDELRAFVQARETWFRGSHAESEETLAEAERELGLELPPSITWLLSTYGYGYATGMVSLDDAVALTLGSRKHLGLPERYVVLNDWGDEGMVLLDTGSVDADGEAAVWWVDQLSFEALGEGEEIAEPAAVYPRFGVYARSLRGMDGGGTARRVTRRSAREAPPGRAGVSGADRYYFWPDSRGSTHLTSSTGNTITQSRAYEPSGTSTTGTDGRVTDWFFAGGLGLPDGISQVVSPRLAMRDTQQASQQKRHTTQPKIYATFVPISASNHLSRVAASLGVAPYSTKPARSGGPPAASEGLESLAFEVSPHRAPDLPDPRADFRPPTAFC